MGNTRNLLGDFWVQPPLVSQKDFVARFDIAVFLESYYRHIPALSVARLQLVATVFGGNSPANNILYRLLYEVKPQRKVPFFATRYTIFATKSLCPTFFDYIDGYTRTKNSTTLLRRYSIDYCGITATKKPFFSV